jgi:hypothetical protein
MKNENIIKKRFWAAIAAGKKLVAFRYWILLARGIPIDEKFELNDGDPDPPTAKEFRLACDGVRAARQSADDEALAVAIEKMKSAAERMRAYMPADDDFYEALISAVAAGEL